MTVDTNTVNETRKGGARGARILFVIVITAVGGLRTRLRMILLPCVPDYATGPGRSKEVEGASAAPRPQKCTVTTVTMSILLLPVEDSIKRDYNDL
eukprot:6570337-Prymnesium_polylepis.1